MKLYATVTGQKLVNGKYISVNKGQGSNTQINIAIFIDNEERPRFRLHINKDEDESTRLSLVDLDKPYPNKVWGLEEGGKQKGECNGKHESVQDIIECSDCSKAIDEM